MNRHDLFVESLRPVKLRCRCGWQFSYPYAISTDSDADLLIYANRMFGNHMYVDMFSLKVRVRTIRREVRR